MAAPVDESSQQLFMCGSCGAIFDDWVVANRPCPHDADGASVANNAQPTCKFEWTNAAVKLLIATCIKHNVGGSTSSKKDARARWEQVVEEFAQHGYHGLTWETTRKKWYRLLERYRMNRDRSKKSGAGAVQWEWYEAMDKVLGKDPNISPVMSISTTPRSQDPIPVVFPETSGSTSSLGSQSSVSESPLSSPVSSQPGKRKRASSGRDQTLRDLFVEEKENRRKYREEKLKIAREKLEVLKSIQSALLNKDQR